MRTARWIVAGLAIGTLAIGCGDDDKADKNAAAKQVCEAQCKRAVECSIWPSQSDCVDTCVGDTNDVRDDSTCEIKQSTVDSCTDALADQTCSDLEDGVVPPVCDVSC